MGFIDLRKSGLKVFFADHCLSFKRETPISHQS